MTVPGFIPVLQTILCKKTNRLVALRIVPDNRSKRCSFEVAEDSDIEFDSKLGTMQGGGASCPLCHQAVPGDYLRQEAKAGRMSEQIMAAISVRSGQVGKVYRAIRPSDIDAYNAAAQALKCLREGKEKDVLPTELISRTEPRRVSPPLYGLERFIDLFNQRQALALATFALKVQFVLDSMRSWADEDYAKAVATYLGIGVSRLADVNSSLCTLNNVGGRGVAHTFTRQSLPMVWDYAESAPFNEEGANWRACVVLLSDLD